MIRKYAEVFKVVDNKSVRGFIEEANEEEFTVKFKRHKEEYLETFKMEDVGITVFEDERDLIKVKGAEIIELAPPRIVELKYVPDFYGESIHEGDFVIAMSDKPLYHKLEGYVSKVYYLSSPGFEKMNFIDLVDEKGKNIYTRALSTMFSTPERFNEANKKVTPLFAAEMAITN